MLIELDTSAATIQLMLGMILGQLVIGPLPDQFGRCKPLLIGAVVCMITSILCALQFTLAAIASLLVGLDGEGSAVPMAIVMRVAGVIAIAGLLLTRGATMAKDPVARELIDTSQTD